MTARIWPNVELQWEDMGGLPPMRRAAVIGAGSWGTAVAVLLARGGLDVQLGARTGEQAASWIAARENRRYLPGVALPDSLRVRPRAKIELAGPTWSASRSLPARCRRRWGRSPTGSAIGPRCCC